MVQSRIKRDLGSSPSARCAAVFCASIVCMAGAASAQQPAEDTRAARVAAEQQEKAKQLKPYEPNKAEVWVAKLEEQFITGSLHWHPFFTSAYAGGGFTLGAGYSTHVSSYSTIDVRGSYTISGYKRIESEFVAPRLFGRRGRLSVIGGWREATSVGFYGIGTDNTSKDDRANYSFKQPYASAMLDVRPRRKALVFGGGVEYSQWDQGPGDGSAPSVDEVYTPATLPGLDATVTYLHTQGTAALDWRTSAGYSRRGGYYGATVHDYADRDDVYSFRQVDYDAIQHLPIFREMFVLSLHGRVETTYSSRRRNHSLLHAAGARRRVEPAWLRELAVSRPSTACSFRPNGACSSTTSSTWRSFMTPARSRLAGRTSTSTT